VDPVRPPSEAAAAAAGARLGRVRAYYDGLAPRLRAVEDSNWHLRSRMALVLETIARLAPPPGRALDVGCGTGFLLERLAGLGWSGIGVDLSPESVAIARERLRALGAGDRLDAIVGSAYEPPEGPFDLIALTDVLEHLEDPRACLGALRARLAPGGLVVVSTPNRRSLPGARRWLAERGVPWIRLSLAPVDSWQTWVDLESHGAAAGLVPVTRRGIFFRPGGRVGSQLGRLYRLRGVRSAELRLSRTPAGRFGFYICLGFRGISETVGIAGSAD
jgi:SAM-dependent methyltransferase